MAQMILIDITGQGIGLTFLSAVLAKLCGFIQILHIEQLTWLTGTQAVNFTALPQRQHPLRYTVEIDSHRRWRI